MLAVLLAPDRPMFPNVGLSALLERRHGRGHGYGFDFLPRRPFRRHDVDAGGVAIALHQETGRIPQQPGFAERDVLKRSQAVPALYAREPIAIAPVARGRAVNDEIEAIAVVVFAWRDLARDVEGL